MKKDIIIIGAGPAGMAAAVYGVRAGKSVLLLDKTGFGGQIVNAGSVENYPSFKKITGAELAAAMHEQALDLGAEFRTGLVTGVEDRGDVKIVKTASEEHEAKAVIVATGASNRKLGVEGELRLTGAGVSYCATCDGNFFRGRTVAVVGGGNTALDDAEVLANLAKQVYLIHRRDSFRGDAATVRRLEAKQNVEFVLDSVPVEIRGQFMVESIVVRNKMTDEEREIPVNGVFVAVGQEPDNQAFTNVLRLDEAGYVDAGEDCLTGTPGVFVAGDCRVKKIRQLLTAGSDGAVAALAAVDYINANS
ncbi:MAG: FAD-dependent oxidoreductase [Eubacterium sp.]|nr:FAD-dependent oxidoreductase [Eubacterium sp.]